jgi:hypothetical protein
MLSKVSERVEETIKSILRDRMEPTDRVEFDTSVHVSEDAHGNYDTMISIYVGLAIPSREELNTTTFSTSHITIPFRMTDWTNLSKFVNGMWDHIVLNRLSYENDLPLLSSYSYVCPSCGEVHDDT